MSEFDNTYMHYEDIPLLGGNLLEFLELDPGSTLNPNFTSNPAVSDCGYNENGLSFGEEIKIDEDFKVLQGLLETPVDYPAYSKQNDYNKPFSPGSDSGLSSPGSAWDSGLSSPGSVWDADDRLSPSPDILSLDQIYDPIKPTDNDLNADSSFHVFTNVLPELSGLDMSSAFGTCSDQIIPRHLTMQPLLEDTSIGCSGNSFSSVAQTNVEVIVPETKELLDELGIEVEPLAAAPESNYNLESLPQATGTGVNNAFSLDSKCEVIPYVIKTDISAVDCVSESNKPKGGRKRKICSVQERKERKREQNKNAATRYRERKRSQMAKRDGELKALKDKNTSLKDETNRINREIDYLRELLLEVYRLKGLVT